MKRIKYEKENLEEAVKNSTHIDEVFINLGLKPNGRNYKWLQGLISKFEISIEHFERRGAFRIKYETGDISTEYRLTSGCLNKFLKMYNVPYKCNRCEIDSWCEEAIILDVDHMDNNPLNNKLENLQYLCPNCHRQKTLRIKAEQVKEKRKPVKSCRCGKAIWEGSDNCSRCNRLLNPVPTKINWPEPEYFKELVWEKPRSVISKDLGVSDTTLRNYLRKNFISFPNLDSGYWVNWNAGNFERCKEIRVKIEDDFVNSYKNKMVLPTGNDPVSES